MLLSFVSWLVAWDELIQVWGQGITLSPFLLNSFESVLKNYWEKY